MVRVIHEQKGQRRARFHTVAERYAATLAAIEDEYLRERADDMRDVTARVLNNLLGLEEEVDLRHLKEPCIIISHDLTPSNTAQLDKRNVLGFATDVGSKTSHTAIMARSLRIPAVVGLKDASKRTGDRPIRAAGRLQRRPDHQSHRPDALRVRPTHPQAGHPGGEAARHPAQTGGHA